MNNQLDFIVKIDGFEYDDIQAISCDFDIEQSVLRRFHKRAKTATDFERWVANYLNGQLKVVR